MAFLTPFFLLGLSAIAIPVLIHLIQREKKRVIEFPSLMFVRRIPYQSVRRRRIRHWALLLMRAAAIALIVAAFARPFIHQGTVAAAVGGGAREVVILLDQSASMGYGDHWSRARDAARAVVRGLGADDRATLVLFDKNAEENMRATSDRTRLEAAINAAHVGSGATRYGPALKLAESILSRSAIKRREAVLVSDFQRSGWSGSEEVRFPEGMTVSTVSVASPNSANLAVPSVTFARASFSGQERITVTAGLSNKGDEPLKDVPVTLTIDGHEIQTERATVAPHAAGSVTFAQFTLTGRCAPARICSRPTTSSISCSRRASRCRWRSSTAAIDPMAAFFSRRRCRSARRPRFTWTSRRRRVSRPPPSTNAPSPSSTTRCFHRPAAAA